MSKHILTKMVVAIECTKEGVKFNCQGDIGSGSVHLRPHTDVEHEEKNVEINLSEPVALTFSLKYLVNFCKASGLSDHVKLCLSNEVPLLVEYPLTNNSYLRFYLAPKVRDVTMALSAQLKCYSHADFYLTDWRRGVGHLTRRKHARRGYCGCLGVWNIERLEH